MFITIYKSSSKYYFKKFNKSNFVCTRHNHYGPAEMYRPHKKFYYTNGIRTYPHEIESVNNR